MWILRNPYYRFCIVFVRVTCKLFDHFKKLVLCSSIKNPFPPHGRSLEIPRGRGVLKVKILEAKYETKLEIPGGVGGRGLQSKKSPMGGVRIFSGTAHSGHVTFQIWLSEMPTSEDLKSGDFFFWAPPPPPPAKQNWCTLPPVGKKLARN